jgi:damage-control phosphatase, subfamily I
LIIENGSSKGSHFFLKKRKKVKTELACIPCIMKQAYNTAKRATNDEMVIREILNKTAEYVKTLQFDSTPADASNYVYETTKIITGNTDPFKNEKNKYNILCKSMIPKLRNIIENSDDKIKTAVRIAIYGNLIDLGIGLHFDLDNDLETVLYKSFVTDDYDELKYMLNEGRKKILYLGDNSGEIVFDALLVEKLIEKHDVVFVVKSGPIINDATREDAEFAGIDTMVKVITTGSDGIGVKWSSISEEFQKEYDNADIIISKGQGNFETMSGKKGTIFFLLRAKCDSVAREVGAKFGDIVIKMQKNR